MSGDGGRCVTGPDGDGMLCVDAGGQTFVVEAECPHRKGRLVYGFVNQERARITCPLHRSTFDMVTGQVVAGPSERPLRTAPGADAVAATVGADGGDLT